ncbi:MAG: hypothetical protein P3B98_03750 [Gemmatimonadota bacterium]|nr:hypothetical protein [Gemmatimonadota bacterium]
MEREINAPAPSPPQPRWVHFVVSHASPNGVSHQSFVQAMTVRPMPGTEGRQNLVTIGDPLALGETETRSLRRDPSQVLLDGSAAQRVPPVYRRVLKQQEHDGHTITAEAHFRNKNDPWDLPTELDLRIDGKVALRFEPEFSRKRGKSMIVGGTIRRFDEHGRQKIEVTFTLDGLEVGCGNGVRTQDQPSGVFDRLASMVLPRQLHAQIVPASIDCTINLYQVAVNAGIEFVSGWVLSVLELPAAATLLEISGEINFFACLYDYLTAQQLPPVKIVCHCDVEYYYVWQYDPLTGDDIEVQKTRFICDPDC